jgi:dihydrodipicolinate synthase/N-acetylneuraminate lyase
MIGAHGILPAFLTSVERNRVSAIDVAAAPRLLYVAQIVIHDDTLQMGTDAMTPTAQLRGILPAMLTPFTEDGGAIDTDALSASVTRLLDAGCGGLIPGGSTGEFTSLSNAERRLLHTTVIDAAAGRAPVYPQTGAMTTDEAIELTIHAQSAGAAGVMVAPPYYDALSFPELKAYYTEVAGSVSIPVMLYNIPSATGQHLTPAQIAELADDIPGVASIKDSSGDAYALTELLERYGDRLQVCNGWDSLTFFGLAAGAKASVWGAANIFPELAVELFTAVAEQGDLDAGRKLWSRLYPVVAFLESGSYTSRVKAACRLRGLPVGPVRRPFLDPADDDLKTLDELLTQLGLTA